MAKDAAVNIDGVFSMTGGKMNLTNSIINLKGSSTFSGGTLDMNDSVLELQGASTAFSGVAKLDFDVTDAFFTEAGFGDYPAIAMNGYNSMTGYASITVDTVFAEGSSTFYGIKNSGTFHQMGGTVTVNNDNSIQPAFLSYGDLLLNAGTMTLNGSVSLCLLYTSPSPRD